MYSFLKFIKMVVRNLQMCCAYKTNAQYLVSVVKEENFLFVFVDTLSYTSNSHLRLDGVVLN
jgi:hypothetical protein